MKKLLALLLAFTPCMANADGLGFKFTGENVPLAATTTSSVATLGTLGSVNAPQVIVYNAASAPAIINCSNNPAVLAIVPASNVYGGVLVPPGLAYEIYKGTAKYCAGILTTGTGTIYFSPGIYQ